MLGVYKKEATNNQMVTMYLCVFVCGTYAPHTLLC